MGREHAYLCGYWRVEAAKRKRAKADRLQQCLPVTQVPSSTKVGGMHQRLRSDFQTCSSSGMQQQDMQKHWTLERAWLHPSSQCCRSATTPFSANAPQKVQHGTILQTHNCIQAHQAGQRCETAVAASHRSPRAHMDPGWAFQKRPIGGSPSANHITSSSANAILSVWVQRNAHVKQRGRWEIRSDERTFRMASRERQPFRAAYLHPAVSFRCLLLSAG